MHSYNTDNQKFKNKPSAVFYDYFYEKLRDGLLDRSVFFEKMGVGISVGNQMQFFTGLKNGHKSITIEHINAAWEFYQVTPNYLFGLSDEPTAMLAEPNSVRINTITKKVGKIRKLLDEIEIKINAK